jgi:hypothetical protein
MFPEGDFTLRCCGKIKALITASAFSQKGKLKRRDLEIPKYEPLDEHLYLVHLS